MSADTVASQAHRARAHGGGHLRGRLFQFGLLLALLAVGLLAWLVRTVDYFAVDLAITRALQRVQAAPVPQLFDAVSWVGYPPQSNLIFGTVILALFVVGLRLEATMTAFAAAGSAGLWFLLAPLVNRPRPSPELVHVSTHLSSGGFPSGHVLNLTAIFGFLIFLATVLVADPRWRALAVGLLAVPILLIGAARVYAGAHWASDALGGYLLGGVWLALTIQVYRWAGSRLDRRRGGRPAAQRRRRSRYNDRHGDLPRPDDAPARGAAGTDPLAGARPVCGDPA